mmetsp:Transcript_21942/g.70913  ORF Transcript_21942/g.70913 Transcript_21942/m.70913 type:complete len:88 (-) Transcript_21942:235-498(-)
MDALVERLAAKVLGQDALNTRDARGAPDEHHLVHVPFRHLGVRERTLHCLEAALEGFLVELVKLFARDIHRNLVLADEALDDGGRLA